MRSLSFLNILSSFLLYSSSTWAQNVSNIILSNAEADGIDLTVLDFLPSVLSEINAIETSNITTRRRSVTTGIIDVHTHVVPSWYQLIVPTTGGSPTPDWNLTEYMAFMDSEGIENGVFSFSAPGANVYPGQELVTIALARLMNEQSKAYVDAYPDRLSFYAIVPLPYTTAAIAEAKYAINTLGAKGIFLTSNFEGKYLGNTEFTPFFDAVNNFGGEQIMYVHPGTPYMTIDGNLIEANPTPYATGLIEFFFETARTVQDLTITQTIHNFTNIHYIIPHVGGAFPATLDRMLKTYPTLYNSSLEIYQTRFWWDSAGPTYYHQVSGLLGYDIPASQLLFGTDYPYAPSYTQAASLAAVEDTDLITAADKMMLFATNAQSLFGTL